MKVALYGNNLNQAYLLAILLNKLGVEAKVFLHKTGHHQDFYHWWDIDHIDESIVIWINRPIEVGSLFPLTSNPDVRYLYSEAKKFDIILLREDGPALFSALDGPIKIFSSQGADLQIWPWWISFLYSVRSIKKLIIFLWVSSERRETYLRALCLILALSKHLLLFPRFFLRQYRQRRGLSQACAAVIAPYQTHLIDKLEYPRSRISYIPVPSYSLARKISLNSYCASSTLKAVYDQHDLIFLHPCRLYFLDTDANPFRKDNHKLIQGFKFFLDAYHRSVKLIIVEKGNPHDIVAAKELVVSLGLSNFVEFVPELRNIDLCHLFLSRKTIVCDQFSPYLNSLGNLGREAVYHGRPLVTSYDGVDDLMYTSRPPNVFTANSSESVCLALTKISSLTQDDLQDLEIRSRAWCQKNLDPRLCAKKYYDLLHSVLSTAAC